MKVIFLDCDGVINGYGKFTDVIFAIADKLHLTKTLGKHYDIFGVHKHKVKLLSKIVKSTNAKIVLSSSWRYGWELIEDGNCIPKTKQDKLLRDTLKRYGMEVYSRTGTVAKDEYNTSWREYEINEWLNSHDNIESFVVLDDEQFDLQSFVGNRLVRTSEKDYICGRVEEESGLKRKHVKQAIKILNQNN